MFLPVGRFMFNGSNAHIDVANPHGVQEYVAPQDIWTCPVTMEVAVFLYLRNLGI